MSETIGDRIANARTEQGLSRSALASLIGVTSSAIAMYESGKRIPSAKRLILLSEILKVSADYLLTGQKKKTADLSGLEREESALIRKLVENMEEKNKRLGLLEKQSK